jgi:lysophospholipid acyltransferase (LPLAT)-like uncharacterized protein
VSQKKEHILQFDDLSAYSLRKRVMIRAADIAFYLAIRLVGATLRYEMIDGENLTGLEAVGRLPIYTFWHDRIFAGTYFFRDRGIYVMSSKSFDGEYIARFVQRFGFRVVRGSSSRGGMRALVGMIRAMRNGSPTAFTVDGPRGPRYKAKSGPVVLAQTTGEPLLPFVVETRHYTTVASWDRLQVPMPFSRVAVIIGEPLFVEEGADQEAALAELQSRLDKLVERGREWRSGGR